MDKWSPGSFLQGPIAGVIFSIVLVTTILLIISFTYYFKVRKMDIKVYDSKIVVLVDAFLDNVKKLIIDNLGVKFIKFTPYIVFLFAFLFLSNIMAMFGMKETTNSYTVPLTLGLITWTTSIFLSIKYQKMDFLKSFLVGAKIKGKKFYFLVNPLEVLGKITPLISITFRIWGNIIAGSIIYSVLFWALGSLVETMPQIGIILLGGIFVMPGLFIYFTLFTGGVQAYVFVLLTVTYWSLGVYGSEGLNTNDEKIIETEIQNQNISKAI